MINKTVKKESRFFVFIVIIYRIQTVVQQKIEMSALVTSPSMFAIKKRKQSLSNSECSTETALSEQLHTELISSHPFELRADLFKTDIISNEISQKVNQKTVSWLVTLCWSKNISQESLWNSMLLYYSMKAKDKIKKENLQLTLLGCLLLSIKLNSKKAISINELTAVNGKGISVDSIIQIEAHILENFNYNIIIPHFLTEIFHLDQSEDKIHQILFLCELFMLRSCQIFFDKEKIEKVVHLVQQRQRTTDGQLLKIEVRQMLKLKDAKIIIKKYSSKFDPESLIGTFME